MLIVAATAIALALVAHAAPALRAWSWGANAEGELGNGTAKYSTVPVVVKPPTGVTFATVAAGAFHSLALDTAGNAWAWGLDDFGQLGNGSNASALRPAAVTMPSRLTFTAIAAGDKHSVALDASGHVWAWGDNANGELGDGTTTASTLPIQAHMPAGVTVVAIAAGGLGPTGQGQTAAIDSTGRAWAWGFNGDGELGNATTTDSSLPVAVDLPVGVKLRAIATNGEHVVALDTTGAAWGWGRNVYGQVGDGTTIGRRVPVQVAMPHGVTFRSVTAGEYHCLAIDSGGRVWSWGSDGHGQLGNGATGKTSNALTPILASMPGGVSAVQIGAGADFSLVLDSQGRAWTWGYNGEGELGDGNTTSTDKPGLVAMPNGVTFSVVSADGTDSDHSLAMDAAPGTSPLQVPEGPLLYVGALAAAAVVVTMGWVGRRFSARRRATRSGV